MKRITSLFFFVYLSTTSYFSISQVTSVSPTNDNIQYFGRWDFSNPSAPFCSWPSLYIKAKFNGTGVTAKFTNPGVDFIYTIDGGAPQRVYSPTANVSVSGLSPGVHEIMVSRTTEYNGGFLTFNGLDITGGDIVEPEDEPCLKFEFVGNSILCGLVADHPTWDNGNGPWISGTWEQNAYMSWGPQLSRMFDAQYRVESHSGQGMSINLNNSLPEVQASDEFELKHYYPGWARAGWDQKYDFSSDPFEPQLFFCSLGTNDWSDQNYNQGQVTVATHIARYNEFIDFVYSKYPNTTFVVMSTLLSVRGWAEGNDALEAMVNQRKANGDDIYFVNMEGWLPSQQDYGNDWTHPTTVGHTTMATSIKTWMESTPAIMSKLQNASMACSIDCNGVEGGSAYEDACGVCVGGNTGFVSQCTIDCHGVENGTASYDSCGVCSGGTTGITPNADCKQDCYGDWGGSAKEDACGICAGGNTGVVACGYGACASFEFDGSDDHNGFNQSSLSLPGAESNGSWTISASNTGQWDAFILELGTGIDFTQSATQKMWIRAKASGDVLIQPAVRDSKGDIASTGTMGSGNWGSQSSNLLQLTNQWQDFTIDFAGNLRNEWGCGCDLNAEEIDQIYVAVNPGWDSQWPANDINGSPVTSGFTGTIEIDYIRLGDENCTLTAANEMVISSEGVKVYPNPAEGTVFLSEESNWTLLSPFGEVLQEGEGSEVSLSEYPSAMYLINIGGKVTRIIKR